MNVTEHSRLVRTLSMLVVSALVTTDVLAAPQSADPRPPATTSEWDRLQTSTPGTKLRLTLRDGAEVTGILVEVVDEAVVMKENQSGRSGLKTPPGTNLRDPMAFQRSDIATVAVLRIRPAYSATGTPNADAVRRVVETVGVGKKVDLRTVASKRVRGKIQSIEGQSFLIAKSGTLSEAERLEYAAVREIKATGMDVSTTALIAIGAALGAVFLINVARCRSLVCSV